MIVIFFLGVLNLATRLCRFHFRYSFCFSGYVNIGFWTILRFFPVLGLIQKVHFALDFAVPSVQFAIFYFFLKQNI